MKVILLNGSPHINGCTCTALTEVARALEDSGIEAQIIKIDTDSAVGCRGCFACRKLGRCIVDDQVNRLADLLESADGMILASPVYFAAPNAGFLAVLDRLYAAHGHKLRYKPCGCIVSARRAGTTAALDALNKYPLVCEQPVVASSYWCMVHGNTPEEVRSDEEGLQIARRLGLNMAWMVKALQGSRPPEA